MEKDLGGGTVKGLFGVTTIRELEDLAEPKVVERFFVTFGKETVGSAAPKGVPKWKRV